jgi:tetratricopeptide (TPR) repeat protein
MPDDPHAPAPSPNPAAPAAVDVRLGDDDDPVPSEMRKLVGWLKANGNWLGLAVAVFAGALIVTNTLRGNRAAQADEMSNLLAMAQKPEDLQTALDLYPEAPGAAQARLTLARSLHQEGALDRSLEQYDLFLSRHATHPMATNARLERLHTLEAQGKHDEALAGFQQFIQENPGHRLLPDAQLGRARCLQNQGKLAEAKQALDDLLASEANETWKAIAREKVGLVERKLRLAGG